MALSYFLWALVLPLALFGRFGTRRVESAFLGDAAVYLSGIASVCCVFGGFFAMLYSRESTSTGGGPWFAGQEGGVVLKWGIAVVVLAVLANFGANALIKTARRKAPPAPEFLKTDELHISIDPGQHTVSIAAPPSGPSTQALAGRLVLSMHRPEIYTGRIRMTLTELVLPHFFQEIWTGTPHAKGSSRVVFSADLPEDNAWALKHWFAAHAAVLGPDEATAKKSWDTRCAALLEQCRQQRQASHAPASETFKFGFGPSIDYAVVEADGRHFVAHGDVPELQAAGQDGGLSRAFA